MPQEGKAPSDVCQTLCLSSDGYEPVTCSKRGDYTDLAQRIQTRFDHIRAVQSNDNNKLRTVNTMYRWLFIGGEFDSERFASALKQSRQCDWVCCGGPAADQNTASGRRAAAHAWGVSEECLTTFFGHDLSGNTWREIGSFAKKAPVWAYARPALVAAREQRLKEARWNKRLSQKKSWTPYDPKTALELCKVGNDHKGASVGHADDGLSTSDNVSVRATDSASCTAVSRERESSSVAAVHATSKYTTNTIIVSSRPVTHEPSATQDQRPKRRRSVDTAVQPTVPKRRVDHLSSISTDGLRNILDAESLETLQSGQGLPSEVIYATLHILECAVGTKLEVVNPTTAQAFNRFSGAPGMLRLIPMCHESHWVLGVLGANQDMLRVYDPQPSLANRKAIKERVAVSSAPSLPPDVKFTAPLLQDTEEDSGLLLVVSALHVSLDHEVPQDVDTPFWREVVRALLMPLSVEEVNLVQAHALGQPLTQESNPEKVALPGGSLNVGEIPTTLAPVEVLALLDKLRAEAFATYQRMETATSSASSALEIVTALRDCARMRCQQDVGNIGVDVIGSLVRLNRLKETYEQVHEDAKCAQADLSEILGRLSNINNTVS